MNLEGEKKSFFYEMPLLFDGLHSFVYKKMLYGYLYSALSIRPKWNLALSLRSKNCGMNREDKKMISYMK